MSDITISRTFTAEKKNLVRRAPWLPNPVCKAKEHTPSASRGAHSTGKTTTLQKRKGSQILKQRGTHNRRALNPPPMPTPRRNLAATPRRRRRSIFLHQRTTLARREKNDLAPRRTIPSVAARTGIESGSRSTGMGKQGDGKRRGIVDLVVMRKKVSPSLAWASAATVMSRMRALSTSAGSAGAASTISIPAGGGEEEETAIYG